MYFKEGDVKSFGNFVRMDPDKFNPGLNLAIILRCLATGDVYKSQAYGFWVVPITIVSVVPEVCKAIYDHYHKTAFKCPTTKEEWKEVAQTSGTSITAGCIDGKHVRMQAPPQSGSLFYNYKGFYSIIILSQLQACGCGCLWC